MRLQDASRIGSCNLGHFPAGDPTGDHPRRHRHPALFRVFRSAPDPPQNRRGILASMADQAVVADGLHQLPGEHPADVIGDPRPGGSCPPGRPSASPPPAGPSSAGWLAVGRPAGTGPPAARHRCPVGPGGVVVRHPGVQGGLGLLDRVEQVPVEELAAHRLVQPLELAGGGRRVRRGEQWRMPLSWQTRSNSTGPGRGPNRAVTTLPLSVRIAWGTPWRANAARRASYTGWAVALGSSLASTQNREWSSIPVTADSWVPSTSRMRPTMSSCHSCIARERSQRLSSCRRRRAAAADQPMAHQRPDPRRTAKKGGTSTSTGDGHAPTGASVAQDPEPRPETVAQQPEPQWKA
jgi:hypothetical protein